MSLGISHTRFDAWPEAIPPRGELVTRGFSCGGAGGVENQRLWRSGWQRLGGHRRPGTFDFVIQRRWSGVSLRHKAIGFTLRRRGKGDSDVFGSHDSHCVGRNRVLPLERRRFARQDRVGDAARLDVGFTRTRAFDLRSATPGYLPRPQQALCPS